MMTCHAPLMMSPIALGLGLSPVMVFGGEFFSPRSLSPFTWYDPSDLHTLFQERTGASAMTPAEVGGPVGTMRDKSGAGRHFTAPSDAARPTLRNSGSLYWLEFDGSDDTMSVTYGEELAQPYERVSAWQRIGSAGSRLMGSPDNHGILYMRDPGDGLRISLFAGSAEISGDLVPDETDFVATDRYSGASSRVALDDADYATGNPGTEAASGESLATFGDSFTALLFYGSVRFDRLLPDEDIALLRAYLAAKQGRVL